jgi:uncharacterized membrane protein (UPF0182 family)
VIKFPRSARIALAIIVGLWLAHRPLVEIATDWLWFDAVGYLGIYKTMLFARLGVGAAGFVIAGLFIGANLSWAARAAPIEPTRLALLAGDIQINPAKISKLIRALGFVVTGFLALMFGLGTTGLWMDLLSFIEQVPFDTVDPVFNRDVGFYVFELPLITALQGLATAMVVVTLIPVGVYHVFQHIYVNRAPQPLSDPGRKQLLVLGALLFALAAFGWWLDRFDLLYQREGTVWGIGYADLNARIPAFWVMTGMASVVSVALLASLRSPWLRQPVTVIGAYVIVRLLLVSAWPQIVQEYSVKPNELGMETEYLVWNIESTRKAYALDRIEVKPFEASTNLTLADLAANKETVDNIRVWDSKPLLTTYQQLQEIRLYYSFVDVDVDRYEIDGKSRQVMLAARELNYAKVPANAQTWVNEHLQYTHGYGLTMSPVNLVTPEGLPELFIQDIPPSSSIGITIDRPEIYYGEATDRYVFVGTNEKEFDYPLGDQNAYTTYSGKGGVPMGSLVTKTLMSMYFQDLSILLSNSMSETTRVMFRRQVRERIQTLVPFLQLDRDPYLVTTDGGLRWVVDAYTYTNRYPYSEPLKIGNRRLNYMRNSVKVVLDAYDGTVDLYVADETDPLVKVYARIFPGVFKPLSEMPASLQSHVRYPVDFFDVQASLYRSYHMMDPTVFYNKEDMWEAPREIFGSQEQVMRSYYLIMKLPGEEKPEFILLVPFVPTGKENMISWMAARCDPEHYGRLVLYQFPKEKVIFGPAQIEARIDQTPEISEQLTLWSQAGSRVVRGNLLVIPIEDALMYVEAIYLQAESAQLPELKRVIVVYENQIHMERTLEQAMAKVFKGAMPRATGVISQLTPADPSTPLPVFSSKLGVLAQQAQAAYAGAVTAQRAGDWATYGSQLKQLERILQALDGAAAAAEAPPE